MALQIIDHDTPLEVKGIVTVLYGIPGVGKTALSFTSEKPFLLDFDNGLQRTVKRKKAAKVESWEDVVNFNLVEELPKMGIKTLIIDTVGTMLDDYVADAVIRADKKNGKRDGSLGITGYGAMKNVFNKFIRQMKLNGIDIILIAHDTEIEESGMNKKTLKVTGGSYDIIKSMADLIGYMYTENDERVLDFNPTDNHHGKNSAEFKKMIVPHYSDERFDTYMADLIKSCKDKMNSRTKEMEEAINKVEDLSSIIKEQKSLEELMIIEDDLTDGLSTTYKVQVEKVFNDHFLKIAFDYIDGITKTQELDSFFVFIQGVRADLKSAIKSKIASVLKEKNWKYDKDQMKIVSLNKKEETQPNEDTKENSKDSPEGKSQEELDFDDEGQKKIEAETKTKKKPGRPPKNKK